MCNLNVQFMIGFRALVGEFGSVFLTSHYLTKNARFDVRRCPLGHTVMSNTGDLPLRKPELLPARDLGGKGGLE